MSGATAHRRSSHMSRSDDSKARVSREHTQLLRLHERLSAQLGRMLDDLTSPTTAALLKEMKSRTGATLPLSDVANSLEEAVRHLKMSDAQVRAGMDVPPEGMEVPGVPNLPAHLQRFLAERAAQPGFTFEVEQDEVRGWVICWKEYPHLGTVRGYGQFYERPYAWIED